MSNSESNSSRTSPTYRNLTCPQDRSPNRISHGKLPIESTHGDRGRSIVTRPTTPVLKPSNTATTHSRSVETSPVHSSSHRRVRTEAHFLPSNRPTRNCVANQPADFSQDCLDEVSLEQSEDKSAASKSDLPGRLFSGLFQGESGSIIFGLVRPSSSEQDDENKTDPKSTTQMADSFTSRPQGKRMTMPSPLKHVSSPSRFSLFGPKSQDSKEHHLPEPADDEFLNLDVHTILFPAGAPSFVTPETMNTLQNNAERAIGQLQAAYKLRTFALHEALAEKSSQAEELEDTQIRLQSIKNQLNGMADKVQEQDRAIKAMAEELKLERQRRQQEEEASRKRSVIMVHQPEPEPDHHDHHQNCTCNRDGSELNKTIIKHHSKRSSGATFHSDSGFESGDESTTESIFSRKHDSLGSPTTIATRASGASSPDIGSPVPLPSLSEVQLAPPPTSTPQAKPPPPKPSAVDKVLRGISSAGFAFSVSRCNNCHGANASDAWGVVRMLKEENGGLKKRIGELEEVVDECITLVGG
ncbi:hypothetical protein AJ79_03353 [Helicocarpus griseus UAMH5409]|uniref:Uncharacterized protein n=1 Tax=Helicocarpus griseus UAMH5409 TaxID=1447875 RepID=A0A2B7XZE1_9EURO|nr:hypothetical protein AJ79_03353 [Helicocarpus griseus UAMH5409]